MGPRKGKLAVVLLSTLGTVLVSSFALTFHSHLLERWYLYRLRNGDEQERKRAFRKLKEMSSREVSVYWIGRGQDDPEAMDLQEFPKNVYWRSEYQHYLDPHKELDELPTFVPKRPGEVYLWADYESVNDGRIALYLANQTNDVVRLPTQDGDLFAKQESKTATGRWRRIQGHTYSGCGNSYHLTDLQPGTFVCFLGRWQEEGDKRQVRYRVYVDRSLFGEATNKEILSNEGLGSATPESFRSASYDELAVRLADMDTIRRILLGDIEVTGEARVQAQVLALQRLESGDEDESVSAELFSRFIDRKDADAAPLAVAYSGLSVLRPVSFRGIAMRVLDSGDSVRRNALIGGLGAWGIQQIPGLVDRVARVASDPSAADLSLVVRVLGYTNKHRVLESVAADERYSPNVRETAQLALARGARNTGVQLRSRVEADENGNWHPPYTLEVEVVNKTKSDISFSYSRPTDFLRFYLEGPDTCIAGRSDKQWYTTPGCDAKPISIAPNASFSVRVHLEDYFAVPSSWSGKYASVWVSLHLPSLPGGPDAQYGEAAILIAPSSSK